MKTKDFVEELLLRIELINGEGNLFKELSAATALFQFIQDSAR